MKVYLQTACVVLCTFGIIMEVIYSGDIWLLFITAGSLAFAVSCKIENRPTKKELADNEKDPSWLKKGD